MNNNISNPCATAMGPLYYNAEPTAKVAFIQSIIKKRSQEADVLIIICFLCI